VARLTHLVTTGGAQSNHCRVTAAAAAHPGLRCTLVVNGDPGDPPRGNALLHRLLGADDTVAFLRTGGHPALFA
jgi:D-cysteine desulfhydrase